MAVDADTKKCLEEAKKGKPRRFVMICKGVKIEAEMNFKPVYKIVDELLCLHAAIALRQDVALFRPASVNRYREAGPETCGRERMGIHPHS